MILAIPGDAHYLHWEEGWEPSGDYWLGMASSVY